MAIEQSDRPCTVVLHDDAVSHDDVLCGVNILPAGGTGYLVALGAKALCVHAEKASSNSDEVSVHVSIAKRFGFENRMKAHLRIVEVLGTATATHVELSFRDQYLSRADMWQIKAHIDASVCYEGQRIKYLGSSTVLVENIYLAGHEVDSAFIQHPQTKLIFRSGSARYTILVQVSKEMLESWHNGDLMYERLTTGFLPDLFRRWDKQKVRHQVTVVLFGRRVSDQLELDQDSKGASADAVVTAKTEDFFHVVVSDMSSTEWRTLLRKLKQAFNAAGLSRRVSLAAKGNLLEAIHMATKDFADDNIDPHLASTGTSIVAVTADTGFFEADRQLLRSTTDLLLGNSIGVDIVSLSPKPFHPVPLFEYRNEGATEYALPHWVDISYWSSQNDDCESNWLLTNGTVDVDDIAIKTLDGSLLMTKESGNRMDAFDEDVFTSGTATTWLGNSGQSTSAGNQSKINGSVNAQALPSVAVADDVTEASDQFKSGTEDLRPDILSVASTSSVTKAARRNVPPHPLMQTNRKISLGPRGIAPSQGVASTTVSAQHAQHAHHERDVAADSTSNSKVTEASSGLAKQIRDSLRRKPSQKSLSAHVPLEQSPLSKPIKIQKREEEEQGDDLADPASLIEKAVLAETGQSRQDSDSLSATPNANTGLSMRPTSSIGDERDALAPWLTLLNPCNPRKENMRVASEFRKWKNIFPKAVSSSAFKWDSLCTPAVLPLMTEMRVSMTDLEKRFTKTVRRLLATNAGAHNVMRQMIAMRLSVGFQIVPIRRLPHEQMPSEQIERMLLSLGSLYHELRCLSEVEVQVSEYERLVEADASLGQIDEAVAGCSIKFRPIGARKERAIRVSLTNGDEAIDWSPLDDQSANPTASTDKLGSCRMRMVLIPTDVLRPGTPSVAKAREYSDDERRIDGIQRLTQMWQRNRYLNDDEQRHRTSVAKPPSSIDRDPNPLAIEYQTRDPSAVVIAYGMGSSGQIVQGEAELPLFAESEMYRSSNFDIAKLVKQMQEPPPSGVEVRDRRWFTRLHLKCFRGDEMVNWLLRVFKDLHTREDAVALGNQLMHRDIFTHVRGKHEFRDGNYFYQIKGAHRTSDYPDTAGFFRGIGRSVPSTPISEMKSPSVRPAAHDESDSSSKGTSTPMTAPVDSKQKKEVMLSQMLQYNVDSTKKSSQLELVNLHYDRIHNPDNCYHIHLDWTNTTPKLIRESVTRWTGLVESYGLRLVQLPLSEACQFSEQHPFDQVVLVKLAVRPPERIPATPHMDAHSFSPSMKEDPNAYHKALLRKLDFVLDLEAANSFPRRVDVRYSWGRPDYRLTQFIHRSGFLLAQISNDGKSDFLLLPNRLAQQSMSGSVKKAEVLSVESIIQNVRSFCRSEVTVKALFDELDRKRKVLSVPSPFSSAALAADNNDVPPMELPPHLIHRAQLGKIV